MNIVPGCLAIVTRGPHAGTEVTVIKFLGKVPHPLPGFTWRGNDNWETSLKTLGMVSGTPCTHYEEKVLLRIDGHQEVKSKERELITQ